jgi:tRNA-splicing ligase RtcB
MNVIKAEGERPIHMWASIVDAGAMQQLHNIAKLPFLHPHGVAAMPDVHWGIGATVGSVIATEAAIIPAAVGVDIGCGMMAAQTDLKAKDLPDSLVALRHSIERGVPLGSSSHQDKPGDEPGKAWRVASVDKESLDTRYELICAKTPNLRAKRHPSRQLGTLGSGNHFIEVCLDESQNVWAMLHSGSRGVGNLMGRHFIELAKRDMEKYFVNLPDADLAFLPDGSISHANYVEAVRWGQDYAFTNRAVMMAEVLRCMRHVIRDFEIIGTAVNCHHNYVDKESHFGRNVWVTRKGAIRARLGDPGIIPGSMGVKSYIVRGLGNPDSYHSCSHGAGRAFGRKAARERFTVADLEAQTKGVECRKDDAVLDELPAAYKDIDIVMNDQKDLVEIVHTLKQVLCVKGA